MQHSYWLWEKEITLSFTNWAKCDHDYSADVYERTIVILKFTFVLV